MAEWRWIQAQRGQDRKTVRRIFIKIQASDDGRPELMLQVGTSFSR